MSRNKNLLLLAMVAALTFADLIWISVEERTGQENSPFQTAVGGIGLSAAVSPAWSFFGVDPRAESACENEIWPIPGLSCPNPYHGCSLADLPEIGGIIR